ncbi:MAG: YlmH/Sll1252 family protein [Fusobacterium sp.]|uniref:YlmH/Sll1252 family protein n=1 Tax=Fusobacterium sp. TaxID=68766 RepID=UPI0026DD0A5E|nr:YlmH/Sll1252 family protein [Fusobacterium sp.]MDO4690908.1 YlmH/Sll1252 family protein [Fusobacterium sp.]
MEKLNNCIELCLKNDTVIYSSNFYPLSQLKNLSCKDVKFELKALNEESEKNIIAFYPKDFPKECIFFPVKFFKILKKSKFVSLEHKHYLGTILSLGIKREVFGDLLIKNEICYGIIIEDMFNFLKENLTKINTSPVEVIEIESDEIPKTEFKEFDIRVVSLRLDSVVAELSNFSRVAAVNYIDLGNVQVNYKVEREKKAKINMGDVIIIRKIGKFIVCEERGLSRKDKLKILIKKFV